MTQVPQIENCTCNTAQPDPITTHHIVMETASTAKTTAQPLNEDPITTHHSDMERASTAGHSREARAETESSRDLSPCQAVGGALGALSAALGVALVGVVTAWVWSCHSKARNKER